MPISPEEAIKLWQEESKLMWSRIQTVSVLEAGVLTGWYKLCETNQSLLAKALLIVGSLLMFIIGILMHRDAQYMKACEDAAGDNFPKPQKPCLHISGRWIAIGIIFILTVCNLLLLIQTHCFT